MKLYKNTIFWKKFQFFSAIKSIWCPKGQPNAAQGGAHGGVGRGDLAYKSDESDESDISIGRIGHIDRTNRTNRTYRSGVAGSERRLPAYWR
ncbi:MAG: hypothetical protein PHG44_01985 [Lentisphaeria bacterium]|nr:hypothetical protein [Lentisphaeria bacterium]